MSAKMEIQYKNNSESVDWNEVSDLFSAVSWGYRPPEKVQSAFEKSSHIRLAYLDKKLVGVGRTVDDGEFYGWVVDLAVLPEYQSQGIGTEILKALENDMRAYLTTMLTAAPGKSGFYEKQGWHKQSAAYIFPRSEEQKHEFTENF